MHVDAILFACAGLAYPSVLCVYICVSPADVVFFAGWFTAATTSKIGSDTSAAPVIDRLVSRANATTPRAELTRIQTKLQRAATRMSQGSNMNLAAVVNRKDSAGSIRDFDADPSQDPDTGTGLGSFAPTPLTGPMSARTASGSSNSGAAGALFSPRTAAMNRQTSYAMVAPSFPGAAPPPGR